MLQNIKKWIRQNKHFLQRENYSIIIVSIFGLWVAWNSLFVITKNNRLIDDIQTKSQETALLELENENLALNIEYFKTNEFIEKAARSDLLLRAPNENVAIAPKTQNAEFSISNHNTESPQQEKSNFQLWLDFFLGRKNQL